MKKFLFFTIVSFFVINTYAKGNDTLTYDVSYNGVTHTIAVGDTVHLGYGSNPYGSFMYIYNSSPPTPLGKEWAMKSGTVTKVKYMKYNDQWEIYIKGKFGFYIVNVPQAIDKEEIVGFNQMTFK